MFLAGSVYKKKADAIVLLHFLFIAIYHGGIIYSLMNPRFAPFHSVFVIVSALARFSSTERCPLTAWEKKYRSLDNPNYSYKNSFTAQYVCAPLGIDARLVTVRFLLFLFKWIPGSLPVLIALGVLSV